MAMASPIDKNIVTQQNQRAHKPAAETRPRGTAGSNPSQASAAAAQGRRSQPAVSVSLSAEALQLLNGNREPVRHARPQAPNPRTETPDEAEAETEVAATGEVFELHADDLDSPRREAPFAHVSNPTPGRYQLPGSRLDITV